MNEIEGMAGALQFGDIRPIIGAFILHLFYSSFDLLALPRAILFPGHIFQEPERQWETPKETALRIQRQRRKARAHAERYGTRKKQGGGR